MQEDIENRTVNLVITSTRLSWRVLVTGYQAMKKRHAEMANANAQKKSQQPKGKQTVKQLVQDGKGVMSIPIGETKVRDFEHIARKYGIDYAIMKDKNEVPPRYLCFFKSKDEDAMDAAFREYSARMMNRQKTPSMIARLHRMIEIAKAVPGKVRHKEQEHSL